VQILHYPVTVIEDKPAINHSWFLIGGKVQGKATTHKSGNFGILKKLIFDFVD